jgi:pseudouridine-5'-phosphate glycosidase
MLDRNLLKLSTEVVTALDEKRAVVALESTVIAHGLPRPQNIETAKRLEAIVREAGATPATVAILEGKLCVGLNSEQLEFLAEDSNIHKVSIRDLPVTIARQWNGATTVATTMRIAHRVGIHVFSTGGIGGVHRGALPDVSADLPELARTPMVVVCSGAKIVLDLPATREWLETYGVTVIGFGCDEMPAFYSRRSDLPVDVRAETADDVAKIAHARRRLGLEGATIVTVPVPEAFDVPVHVLHEILDVALFEAERRKIVGRDLTPFLLASMTEQSRGATLRANIALLENNARVATEVALAISSQA